MAWSQNGVLMAERFKSARKENNFTQGDVAKAMGFNDRQIVSNIESVKRKLSAEELLNACKIFNKELDYFTNPYLSNYKISWRALKDNEVVNKCEKSINKIINASIHFSELLGEYLKPIDYCIPKYKLSSFESVSDVAESLGEMWDLGTYPAMSIVDKIQTELNIDVLYIDCPIEISGGACKTGKLDFIFINKNEIQERQHFTLGHELFHILTWDDYKPTRIDPEIKSLSNNYKKPKIETLADIFTSTLLIPKKSIINLWESKGKKTLYDWVTESATKFQVSWVAFSWRMVNLGYITKDMRETLAVSYTKIRRRTQFAGGDQALYNRRFVYKIYCVIKNGLVSIKKIVDIIEMCVDDIIELLNTFNLKLSYEV